MSINTTRMKTAARIPFRRLGAENRSLGFKNRQRRMIFSRNKIQGVFRFLILPVELSGPPRDRGWANIALQDLSLRKPVQNG